MPNGARQILVLAGTAFVVAERKGLTSCWHTISLLNARKRFNFMHRRTEECGWQPGVTTLSRRVRCSWKEWQNRR